MDFVGYCLHGLWILRQEVSNVSIYEEWKIKLQIFIIRCGIHNLLEECHAPATFSYYCTISMLHVTPIHHVFRNAYTSDLLCLFHSVSILFFPFLLLFLYILHYMFSCDQ